MLSLFVSLQSFFVSAKDRLSREERGATAVEYGLLVGLIAVVIIGALIVLGPKLSDLFSGVAGKIPTIAPTP